MKKVIFCDIDNTLARKACKISKKNIIAIKDYVEAGGDFILSTGRSIVSASKFQNQIDSTLGRKPNFIICSNGGYIVDNIENKVITQTIPNSLVREILAKIKQVKVWAMVYTEEGNQKKGVFCNKTWFWFIVKMFKSINCLKIKKDTVLDSFKINLTGKKRCIRKFKKILDEEFAGRITYSSTMPYMIEITPLNISKASAVKLVQQIKRVTKNDCAAFGDSGNDIEMFKNVDLPIAINTKNMILKNIAKHEIPKFKNGVNKAIRKYII
ncbi:MAG: sugar-phosphatase [Mycoplasmoidaceae bacterium]|nr:MAG: sugar-phosphatase [Mycoplasmoidaceae bacterium]